MCRELSLDLDGLWVEFGILTARDRIRMLDDELTAQLFGVLIDGITSSGATYINSLYQRFDDTMVHGKGDKESGTVGITNRRKFSSRPCAFHGRLHRH